ncbi:MAG: hypothetical protein IPI23_16635 [Bacteroidetes bacterium]|nr:hypothetical protein [Bacteroidota bacterium]
MYIQQRDKFLAYYSAYLFSLATYIGFKLWSNNYDPFAPTDNVWYYVLEESTSGVYGYHICFICRNYS